MPCVGCQGSTSPCRDSVHPDEARRKIPPVDLPPEVSKLFPQHNEITDFPALRAVIILPDMPRHGFKYPSLGCF